MASITGASSDREERTEGQCPNGQEGGLYLILSSYLGADKSRTLVLYTSRINLQYGRVKFGHRLGIGNEDKSFRP